MKIIVSHDVDHLYWREHWFRDLYIPKLAVLSGRQLLKGVISPGTFLGRLAWWRNEQLNRLEELTSYEKSKNIPSTYFFGMRQGLSLSYTQNEAAPFITYLRERGFDVGVHGMEHIEPSLMAEERQALERMVGEAFGIRMHYLRLADDTLNMHSRHGYLFDSTEYAISAPYRIGNMWEFPISIMDVYAVRPFQKGFKAAEEYSMKLIREAQEKDIPYFVINFHDIYFCEAFAAYRDWFLWIIDHFKSTGHEFISFARAVNELEHAKEYSKS